MTRWQETFEKHPLHTTLDTVENALNADIDIKNSEHASEWTRLEKIIRVTRQILKSIDPDLAPFNVLNSINQQITNGGILNCIRNFEKSQNPQFLIDANAQMDQIIAPLYQISSLKFARSTRLADLDAATSSFEKFTKTAEKTLGDYIKTTDESTQAIISSAQQIKQMSDSTSQASKDFDLELDEWRIEKTNALNSQSKEFTELINASKTTASNTIKEIQDNASGSLQQFFKQLDETTEKKSTQLFSHFDSLSEEAKAAHKKILDLYGIVARDSVIGGYKSIADREYSSAQSWRRGAVTCIVLTIVWLLYSLLCLKPIVEPEPLFWLQIGKSAVITALLISFGIYASKQANLHRANEKRTRAFSLQVQAFDPFIANLPDDDRATLKKALSERIFGVQDNSDDEQILKDSSFQGLEQVVLLIERVKKAVGK